MSQTTEIFLCFVGASIAFSIAYYEAVIVWNTITSPPKMLGKFSVAVIALVNAMVTFVFTTIGVSFIMELLNLVLRNG